MGKLRLIVAIAVAVAVAGLTGVAAPTAVGAATNPWPHSIVNGFSTPDGAGFWLVYADGTVSASGSARWRGDASHIALNGPIVGGAVTPDGKGYWLVAMDGGIFTYGDAHFYGSMGATHLNQPVFSMSSTKSGRGYWLVARDGGIFSFGDAHFYGSTGSLTLNQPIDGITTSPSGRGYRMVARDGGIFSFGDVPYYGSLPGRGVSATDAVGMAPTPTNKGYWIARSGDKTLGTPGHIYSFGDARSFATSVLGWPSCDPIAAIFSNPKAQGFRLVTQSGATLAFGSAPGGNHATGTPTRCPPIGPPPGSLLDVSGNGINTTQTFSVPANWDIYYGYYDCPGGTGNFIIYVYDGNGQVDVAVNEVGAGTNAAVTHEHNGPDTVYLQIVSECAWNITVYPA